MNDQLTQLKTMCIWEFRYKNKIVRLRANIMKTFKAH